MSILMDKTKHIHGAGLYKYVDISTVFPFLTFPNYTKVSRVLKYCFFSISISIAIFVYYYLPYFSDFCFAVVTDT